MQDDVAPPRLSRRARRRGGTVSRTRARGRLEIRGGDRLRLGHVVVRFVGRGRVPRSTASRTSAFHAAPRRRFRPRRSFRARVVAADSLARPFASARPASRPDGSRDEPPPWTSAFATSALAVSTRAARLIRAASCARNETGIASNEAAEWRAGGVAFVPTAAPSLPSPPSPPSLPSFPSLVSSLVSSPSLFPDRPLVPVVSAARSANAAATRVSAMGKKAGRVLSVAARPHSCALENSRSSRRSAACAPRGLHASTRGGGGLRVGQLHPSRGGGDGDGGGDERGWISTRDEAPRVREFQQALGVLDQRREVRTSRVRVRTLVRIRFRRVRRARRRGDGRRRPRRRGRERAADETRRRREVDGGCEGGASRRGRRRESSRGNAADAADATRGGECLERGNGGGRARDEGARV